ncbi:MAG TPA: protein phosphatase 2C domain-containing protein [Oligoflexia bacterium]|nr:protein phosphatase 2C domain-containing protein [Oligoflexia bacterium]HMP27537.1 protein phosphatase 2C domain-containing protein [Oligoflexia bacterium]
MLDNQTLVESELKTQLSDSLPAAITDTGVERQLNEDRYGVITSPAGTAWLVCDGMGGVSGGELAAQLALDAIRRELENSPARPCDVALASSIREANRVIVLRRQNKLFSGMGTTVSAVMFNGSQLAIASVGDSRIYLVRDGAIQQLSVDHTYVQELVDQGKIKAEDALAHPQAHVLTKCLGSEVALDVDVKKYWIWPADQSGVTDFIVLCTDGLYSLVTEGEIANCVSALAPAEACSKLVELSRARGGFDNITIAIVPVGGVIRNDPLPASIAESDSAEGELKRSVNVVSRDWLKMLILVGVLSGLAMAVTVIAVLLFLTR